MDPEETRTVGDDSGGWFPRTRWSVVVAAHESPTIERDAALAEWCRIYWKPVYLFIRSRGNSPDLTEDLTQEFFLRVIRGDLLKSIEGPERGRLRSFLCTVLKRFLTDEYRRSVAKKRGSEYSMVAIDSAAVEPLVAAATNAGTSPELIFDRQWAIDLLDEAMRRLRDDYARAGKEELFGALRPTIRPQQGEVDRVELAAELGMSEGALKVAIHRLRQRYRECLMNALRDTLDEDQDPGEELRYLLSLFSRG